jgi:murein DD-endopeptidase MepM/ murein hydrolase activator NlpD
MISEHVVSSLHPPTMGNMRWPVKGKIISEYGAKPNGLKNEGINIAVPEGTGVRAAESGVVAYAGNELKGYGNLVLIRHEGGWVTAYAHAKELFVKRGDTVKRGDVIAKAGQTGSVSSPQLHFEVRKGATAMDPVKFLASTTASN